MGERVAIRDAPLEKVERREWSLESGVWRVEFGEWRVESGVRSEE